MSSSPTVTLFTRLDDSNRRPLSLAISALVHAAVIVLVALGVLYPPQVNTRVVTDHYVVRRLDLHTPDPAIAKAARGVPYPGPRPVSQQKSSQARSIVGAAGSPAPLRLAVQAKPGAQTLLQPDLSKSLAENLDIPVPQVLIWSPRQALPKVIVAPRPAPPTAATTQPSLDAPNREVNLADVNMASSNLSQQKLQIMAGTTSPIVVHGRMDVQLPPSTTTQLATEPTPTAVLSLSDLRAKDGTAALPPVNETARASASGPLVPAPMREKGAQGTGDGAGKGNAGLASANSTAANGAPPAARPRAPEGLLHGEAAGSAPGANSGSGQSGPATDTQITLPRDGNFGAIVVGDALQDQFPEVTGVWGSRMAYTVYLHVGLNRSWILQYTLPRAEEASANGSVAHLEAPWPFSIVRPNLAPGAIDADALMVHGYVNPSGRFEELSMAFPQGFPQTEFVIKSLEQWQFRPATQDGRPARVEVLLIIPEDLE